LRETGYTLLAVEQVEKSMPLHRMEAKNGEKLAVVFGNEVTGVDAEVLALCHGSIEIPQMGMKHSLNISVAAGIVLWELFKKLYAEAHA
jgi:tRNA G18 (ribose-2'-O)-methylase SpoU